MTVHYHLHCPNFSYQGLTLMNNIRNIDDNFVDVKDSKSLKVFLYAHCSFNDAKNKSILNTTIE